MVLIRQALVVLWFLSAADFAAAAENLTPTVLPDGAMTQGWYGNFSDISIPSEDASDCWDSLAMAQGSCGVVGEMLALEQFDQRAGFEASLGYRFSSGFQIAGEFQDWGRMFDEKALSAIGEFEPLDRNELEPALMLSGAYSFETGAGLKPFVGMGIGGVHVQYDPMTSGEAALSESEPAWKLGVEGFAGLQYELGPDMRIGLRYSAKLISKWNGGDAADVGQSEPEGLRNRAIMLTFTYEFGGS
jgi:opacity protein-like surface antigen